MAQDLSMPDRQQVFYLNAAAIAAGQTLPEIAAFGAGAAGAYVINKAAGMGRVQGVITGTAAPAAGFPRIRYWSAPGDATALTSIFTSQLTVDPNNAFSYVINEPLLTPFFTIEWTQGVGGGTISGGAWVYPYTHGSGSSSSGGTIYVKDQPLTPLGYQQITGIDNVTPVGLTVPAGSIYAFLQVSQGGTNVTLLYRDDGVNPTATVGFPLIPGVFYPYEVTPLTAIKFIGTAAGTTTLNVLYYK